MEDNTGKRSILSKVTYRSNQIPTNPKGIIYRNRKKIILKFVWNLNRPKTAKDILKKYRVGGLILPDLKTYYKGTVIKTKQCDTGIKTDI